MGSEDFDTNKGMEDFENRKAFIEYCKDVARVLYKIFTGKDLDDK